MQICTDKAGKEKNALARDFQTQFCHGQGLVDISLFVFTCSRLCSFWQVSDLLHVCLTPSKSWHWSRLKLLSSGIIKMLTNPEYVENHPAILFCINIGSVNEKTESKHRSWDASCIHYSDWQCHTVLAGL